MPALCHIRPNQRARDKHHYNGGGEMDLKALVGRGSGHGSRSVPGGAALDEAFAKIPNQPKRNDCNGEVKAGGALVPSRRGLSWRKIFRPVFWPQLILPFMNVEWPS